MAAFLNMSFGEFLLWLLTLKMEVIALALLIILMLIMLIRSPLNPKLQRDEMIDLLKQIKWNTNSLIKNEQSAPANPIEKTIDKKPPIL
jgi:hypothetical protein